MAAHSLQTPSLRRPSVHGRRRHFFSTDPAPSSTASSPFLAPAPPSSAAASFSLSSVPSTAAVTASTDSQPHLVTLDALLRHLAAQNFRQADEETRRLLLALAGEGAQRRGYVYFTEVQFIPAEALKALDDAWLLHSGGRFGYSVQRKLWGNARGDFTSFFIKVGWMKRLESGKEEGVEQYNYREFPEEFVWELKEETPEGHLPLTNCLRGTQLLGRILTHPAFDAEIQQQDQVGEDDDANQQQQRRPPLMGNRMFEPADYSF